LDHDPVVLEGLPWIDVAFDLWEPAHHKTNASLCPQTLQLEKWEMKDKRGSAMTFGSKFFKERTI
jgi:hypothetical protein